MRRRSHCRTNSGINTEFAIACSANSLDSAAGMARDRVLQHLLWQQFFIQVGKGRFKAVSLCVALPTFTLMSYFWIERPFREAESAGSARNSRDDAARSVERRAFRNGT